MTQNTTSGCVRAICPRRIVTECCIRLLGFHNHLTSTKLRWFGLSRTAEWMKSSQQVLSICGNSFKTVGKAFQVKLVERMPSVQICHQGKGWLLWRISNINVTGVVVGWGGIGPKRSLVSVHDFYWTEHLNKNNKVNTRNWNSPVRWRTLNRKQLPTKHRWEKAT